MKIVFLDYKTLGNDVDLSHLQSLGNLELFEVTKDEEVVPRSIDADIIITNKVVLGRETLAQLPRLKLVCIAATGMNNVDLEFARKSNILVKNVSGYSTNSVAQLTFTCVTSLYTNLHNYRTYTAAKDWTKSPVFTSLDFPFYELEGKVWGIIGLGTIGEKVASIAKAFGCRIVYYSSSDIDRSSEYKRLSLENLLRTSDIITIHAPLNEKTNNLIGLAELCLIKLDSVLVNMGRGGIINENELANFLDTHDLKVALDVLEKEPISEINPLNRHLEKPNFILTPHIAWSSKEARQRLLAGIVNNIRISEIT